MAVLGARSAPPRPRLAVGAMLAVALGYSVVALELALADARPNPAPWLRIASADYFAWGALFYAPVLVAGWLLATAGIHAVARAAGACSSFDDLLVRLAAATAAGTAMTLVPDLVTSPLRVAGVISERAYEAQTAGNHGVWFWFTWATLVAYIVVFIVGYGRAVRAGTSLRRPAALALAVAGFALYQGFLLVFIR
jgi:hypothetical protein